MSEEEFESANDVRSIFEEKMTHDSPTPNASTSSKVTTIHIVVIPKGGLILKNRKKGIH